MPPAGGPEENHYSIQLEEVTIVLHQAANGGWTLIHETEEIWLAYKKIKRAGPPPPSWARPKRSGPRAARTASCSPCRTKRTRCSRPRTSA